MGGTHSVMVIITGNGCVAQVKNLDKVICISYSTKTLGKSIHPMIFPPAMSK